METGISTQALRTETHSLFEDLTGLISCLDPAEREKVTVRMPFNGRVLGELPVCNSDDVNAAMKRARRAQAEWEACPLGTRTEILLRLHDLILERRDDILDLMQVESGKARIHAFEEVLDVAQNARYYAYRGAGWLSPRRRRGAVPLLTRVEERRHPYGVVGVIAPWNYPFVLSLSDALPALLAGNAVIMMPDVKSSMIGLFGLQLLQEAGLPEAVLQIITGPGATVGPLLIEEVDYVSFTGSTATGRIVAQQAAARLIPSSLELGGKNPLLILEDADLEKAVEGAVKGCFTNAGQLCISIERIYVQEGLYEAFRKAFVARVQQMVLGSGFGFEEEMGSLVGEAQFNRVVGHVEQARAEGARVLTGGTPLPKFGPWFYAPTVLEGVRPGMDLYREETFGPVVSLYPFTTIEEGISLANDTEYGLNASVFTRNTRLGRRIAARIKAGSVEVNDTYAAGYGSVDAPMGGRKSSGLGRRHGKDGLLKYTEAQTIAVQHGMALAPSRTIPPETYVRVLTTFLKVVRHIPGLR